MIRCETLILAVVATFLACGRPARAQSVSEMLEEGIYKEETVGDLDAAIKIYEQIVSDAAKNRSYAARAQYRLGMCYLKKGQKSEAVAAFRKLIDEFPKHEESVAKAKSQLAALGHPATTATTRRVWAPAEDVYAPSPDGRYLTFINWANGNLAVHDVNTGDDQELTDEGSWENPQAFSDNSIWSPDSRQIAYCWIDRGKGNSLRIVGLDGTEPHVLYVAGKQSDTAPWPVGWSPDGKCILALHGRKNPAVKNTYKGLEAQIVMVSIADGSMRVLKSLGEQFTHRMSLSPDGRYVAFELEPRRDSGKCDIHILATDGSGEAALVEHPADDHYPFWTPDGTRIVFMSDRSGTNGLWMLDVLDGKPVGTPRLIQETGENFYPKGFDRNSGFYYSFGRPNVNVYVAELDFEAGEVVSGPTKVSLSFEGANYAPVWSPNGRRLAFASQREDDRCIIVIQSAETGESRDLVLDTSLFVLRRRLDATPRWFPDGQSILVSAIDSDRKPPIGLYRVDIDSGEITPVVRGGTAITEGAENTFPLWPVLSGDGKQLYYISGTSIIAHDLQSGRERELHRSDTYICRLALSPDERQLAFLQGTNMLQATVVKTMPASGGAPTVLYALTEKGRFAWGVGLSWTADGRYVVVGRPKKSGDPDELWCIPVTGGDMRKLNLGVNVDHLVLHPDGKRIAMTCQEPGGGSELWVMENLLPEPTAAP